MSPSSLLSVDVQCGPVRAALHVDEGDGCEGNDAVTEVQPLVLAAQRQVGSSGLVCRLWIGSLGRRIVGSEMLQVSCPIGFQLVGV